MRRFQFSLPLRPTRPLAALLLPLLAGACAAGGDQGPFGATNTADNGPVLARPASAASGDSRGGSPFGDYLAGQFANDQRDMGAAADFMARALADDPDNPALLQQTFLLMLTEGRMDEALDLAGRAADAGLESGAANLLLALERVRQGDHADARERLSALPDRGLSSLVKPLIGAWVASAEGDTAKAEAALAGLDDVNGVEVLRRVHSGLIHDRAGNDEAAGKAFDQAIEAAGGLSLRMAWLVGNFHARHGRTDEAVALYNRYLAENPESVPIHQVLERTRRSADTPAPEVASAEDGMAEGLFNLAGLLNQQGAGDLGMIYARMAIYLREDFDGARMLLGEIMQSQGRSRDALAIYRAIPERSPFHYVARLRAATELETLERRDEAANTLEALAADYPARYEPLFRLGNLHRSQQAWLKASETYARALKRIEQPEQRHWSLYYFNGIALERQSRWAEAEKQFETALKLEPEQPYVMNYLAYSWVEQETNLDKAKAMLRRAVEMRPEDGYIVDSLGWVHYRLGNYDKAVTHLERAVELRPQDPVINDHLGDAYWKVGRRAEARFQWRRALSLNPEEEVIASIEAKLEDGLEAAPKPNG